jgi:hypothetical protein
VACRWSAWERKGKQQCRTFICHRRRIAECVEDDWWTAIPLPASTRASEVCGRGCTEETLTVNPKDRKIGKPPKRRR